MAESRNSKEYNRFKDNAQGDPAVRNADTYTDMEVLADQSGSGAVLTFTFTNKMDLIWVRADGGNARATGSAQTPTSSFGIVCEDGIPQPMTINATVIKVFAGAGVTVNVWGYRY